MLQLQTNRLRVLRAERRYTQRMLTVMVPMTTAKYWQIENGWRMPTDDERAALARAFKVDEAALGFERIPRAAPDPEDSSPAESRVV